MGEYLYELALYCGRFQPMHKGHVHVAKIALKVSKQLLILVGSSQESGTTRNPFTYEIRKEKIERIFAEEVKTGRVIIAPLPDLSKDPERDITPNWGKFVLQNVKQLTGRLPDVMVYGNDEARSKWFDTKDIKDIGEIIVSRSTIGTTATTLREYISKRLWELYLMNTDEGAWDFDLFDKLYDELVKVDYYKNISNAKKSS
jgi:nicotinamide-nucleotide adenylyltransferase